VSLLISLLGVSVTFTITLVTIAINLTQVVFLFNLLTTQSVLVKLLRHPINILLTT